MESHAGELVGQDWSPGQVSEVGKRKYVFAARDKMDETHEVTNLVDDPAYAKVKNPKKKP